MSVSRFVSLVAVVVCVCLVFGCESDDNSNNNNSGGAAGNGAANNNGGNGAVVPAGTYGGVWTGSVCGRTLTMTVNQSGTTLSGSYTLNSPTFTENFSGTVSSETAPATATLQAGGDRSFQLTFSSYNGMNGGYLKSGVQVCAVNASK